jgi:hypothetical protein
MTFWTLVLAIVVAQVILGVLAGILTVVGELLK